MIDKKEMGKLLNFPVSVPLGALVDILADLKEYERVRISKNPPMVTQKQLMNEMIISKLEEQIKLLETKLGLINNTAKNILEPGIAIISLIDGVRFILAESEDKSEKENES